MPYAVYAVKREHIGKIDEVLKDDLVSRQSISVRDSDVFKLKDHGVFVLVEGSEAAMKRAVEIFSPIGARLEGEKKSMVYDRFKEEEGNVLGGMGLIFGG